MTNYEKYKEIIDLTLQRGENIAFNKDTKEVMSCQELECENCLFSHRYNKYYHCDMNKIKWLVAEYVEPEVDWSKVAVDTPILVSIDNVQWYCKHFAKYENGLFYVWDDGRTSYTTNTKSTWEYAKLAEVDNE